MIEYSEMVNKELVRRIRLDNPWWNDGAAPADYMSMSPRHYIDELYPEISNIGLRRAPILMGPRRVGKTVMIYHVIDRLLRNGVNPRKILYFSLDTPIYNRIGLEQLFNYGKEAAEECDGSEGYYVFYDEVQYLKDWEQHLKSMVDTYRHSKFVASGSAAAALKMKSKESGAGRFTDFMLPPLTFAEFIELQGLDNIIEKRDDAVWGRHVSTDIEKLNEYFIDYINFGGYPEVVFSNEVRKRAGLYVKNDIVEKVLMRDLPSLYGISDTQELNSFFAHLAFRSGNEFSYKNLSTDSGIRKETVKKYLDYLEAAFLIKVLKRVDQNAKRFERMTTFKVYLTNPMLRSALFSPITEEDDAFGSIVETALIAQWLESHEADYYYANWHVGREKGEVDLVWTNRATQKACYATEIKWSDRYFDDPAYLKSLESFLHTNPDIKKALVTTKTKSGIKRIADKEVVFIPSSLYAYEVSKLLHSNKENQLYL